MFVQQQLALLDAQLKKAAIDLNQLEADYLQLQTVMENYSETIRKQEKSQRQSTVV